VAIRPTVAASLPAAVFREILDTHPPVALSLLRRLAEVVRESTDRIMDLSTLGAHNRVYAELLREARDSDAKAFERGANQASIRPIPVHSDIAARVSTTRETVARVLGELARKGIVERDSDALVLRDVARLTKMIKEFRVD
jgi:CRP/FNR family transcriptional regulator, cyclic AMP receptor protein